MANIVICSRHLFEGFVTCQFIIIQVKEKPKTKMGGPKMLSFALQILLYASVIMGPSRGTLAPGFVIQNKHYCIRGRPPRGIVIMKCSKTLSPLFKWRWLRDGQLQNIGTGLCIDTNTASHDSEMKLSKCYYRKSFQKFHCYKNVLYPAHTKRLMVWSFFVEKTYNRTVLHKVHSTGWTYIQMHVKGATGQLCYLGPRDNCLQTIGTIPAEKGKCLVFLSKKDDLNYLLVPIGGKHDLKQFTISFWLKGPPQKNTGIFSYVGQNNRMEIGLVGHLGSEKIQFYFSGNTVLDISTSDEREFIVRKLSGVWSHVAFTWSSKTLDLHVYINGDHVNTIKMPRMKALPGTGTLMLARVKRGDDELGFAGFLAEFNIYGRELSVKEIQLITAQLHCCNIGHQGDWLSWNDIWNSGKMFGKSRRNVGAECTSFEALPTKWNTLETNRWDCRSSLFVTDRRYIPDDRFTSSSSEQSTSSSNGRASSSVSRPWCPDPKDHHSYLQVDLGKVKKLTAVGTAMLKKYKGRYAEKVKLHHSVNGMVWKTDKMIYDFKPSALPEVKIVHLSSPIMARYVRFYPSGSPQKSCLSVDVFGCEPDVEKRIFEGEDGCIRPGKPYILMDLGELHDVRRIQVIVHQKNSIRSFYIHYMSWNYWVPYQVQKKLKIFKGSGEINQPFTHVLPIPILTRFVKIFPTHQGKETCADFVFIGCPPSRKRYCRNCDRSGVRQCSLGYVGSGVFCQDYDECEAKGRSSSCDKNSYCKNKLGSYECTPCKHGFIGDGKVCQTPCEALGIICDPNSFCDISECRCYEGFVNNGTHCVEEFKKITTTQSTLDVKDHLDGTCSDGFFNCYGDVLGTLEMFKRATSSHGNFDIDECHGDDVPPAA